MRLFIDAEREAYDPGQVYETMTIGELIDALAEYADGYGEDMPVFLRHDRGYTYGGITEGLIEIEEC